jgi:hypothetical protein
MTLSATPDSQSTGASAGPNRPDDSPTARGSARHRGPHPGGVAPGATGSGYAVACLTTARASGVTGSTALARPVSAPWDASHFFT